MSVAKRIVAAAVVVIALIVAAVSFGGGAEAYAPTSPTIQLDHNSGPVGDKVVVTGSDFTAGKSATLEFHSTPVSLGSVTISSGGTFSVTITVPSVAVGAHSIVATDVATGSTASAAFSVTGSGTAGGGGTLASTGVAVIGIASVGLVLLVGGGLMLVAGRRRKVEA